MNVFLGDEIMAKLTKEEIYEQVKESIPEKNEGDIRKLKVVKGFIIALVAIAVVLVSVFVFQSVTYTPLESGVKIEAGKTLKVEQLLKNKKGVLKKGLTEEEAKTVGKHQVVVTVGGKDYTTTVEVVDHSAPVITNTKDWVVQVHEKRDFTEGVQVTDNANGKVKLSVDTSKINKNKLGAYEITYIAKDASGNVAKKNAKVTVELDPQKQVNPPHKEKIVYLTFDDGPSQNTKPIVDILKQNGVVATFFVTAQYPGYFNMMKYAHENGNAICAHTYTHQFSIYKDEKTYFEDLDKINAVIKKYTGQNNKILRFPGGSSNAISRHFNKGIMKRLTREVQLKGYQYVDWNVDSTDASGNNVPVAQLVKNACGTYSNDMCILMHDTGAKKTTVEALPQIIKFYKDHGYTFKAITDTSYINHHKFITN
ncbi:MAG TPA: polysaccharide deacetylase [Kandleria vitulina]|nr:polysaccharide deacetylase [Kandleria vitulina]HBG67125.1 polysaccharide deacetylase [Kandleria vitulina]HCY52830.1 polysaccharide deacetylase [Kandleria vitulina]